MQARYDFGRNWSELAARFEEEHVERAMADLRRLVGDVDGRTFLDVGCGSGLHAVAALRLGARRVEAVDYDPQCVATAGEVLARFAPPGTWTVQRADALDPATLPEGPFDIVYSWGVLHHTGDMWTAIRNAASRVAPGGRLALALYVRTPLCGAWTVEKRIYSRQHWLRPVVKYPFAGALLASRAIRNRDAISYVRDYRKARGMEFMVDVDDWLGGYPYESVEAEVLEAGVTRLGFRLRERFNVRPRVGLFGTGCGEWRFERQA
jgi:2-polyprenyl-6-hydroxyphenyl methylase/3-demethylubiquinone-9 3-methyltransferase